MKSGASVSKAQLDSATLDTQRELARVGFWSEGSRLLNSEVYWCRLPQVTMPSALGFFIHKADTLLSLLGYEAGHTYIPQWVLSQGPWRQRRGSLRDVVRHEYGHAVAHYYPNLIQRSTRFSRTFGGRYFGARRHRGCEGDFVSSYAMTSPAEDFAETFMLFLRHGARLPPRFTSFAIKCKWQFITDLAVIVESGGTKW